MIRNSILYQYLKQSCIFQGDVMTWKRFTHYWAFGAFLVVSLNQLYDRLLCGLFETTQCSRDVPVIHFRGRMCTKWAFGEMSTPRDGQESFTCFVMTSSNGNIFRVTGPLCGNSPVIGEFPAQRPVTRRFEFLFSLISAWANG